MRIKVTNVKEWLKETREQIQKDIVEARMKEYREKMKETTEDDDSRETSTDSQ